MWVVIVSTIVLLAIYVSVGRLLASLTASYQQAILLELNHRLPFVVEARNVSAEWHSFTPVLVLEGLRLTLPGEPDHPLRLAGGRIGLDVAGSLQTRSLQASQLRLDGLGLAGELTGEGKLRIRGFEGGGDPDLADWAEEFLRTVEHVALDDMQLVLSLPGGEQREFDLDLALYRDGSRRWLEAQLQSSRGLRMQAVGEGVGNPFDPETFTGQLYLDVAAVELGALLDLAGNHLPPLQLSGGIALNAWLSWDRGEPSLETRLELDHPLLAAPDGSWTVPLDRVSFEATAVQRKEHWGLSIADLQLSSGEAQLQVPRLQLDASGATLQARATGLHLGPLSALVGQLQALPPAVRDVIAALRPRGLVPALQLDITDVNTPLEGWGLRAELNGVAVDAWEGAPGVTGAGGYLFLAPGEGTLVLDSSRFSLDFPTVYRQPLDYDDFHGTFHIAWDDRAVTLSSSLVEAAGAEGEVKVLFGLSVPLVESAVGPEMDLLVGLQDSRTKHRDKYIPFTLEEGLRDWLAASIGPGRIEQGGFLWRGSLRPGTEGLHTVQLFFNIADTALQYHPDWPALAAVDGTVLIDDSNVSVWADNARLLESRVSDLGVEVSLNALGQLLLAAKGRISGPAGDTLAVINDSPLGQMAGGAFANWRLQGEVETGLELLLNLSDSTAAPRVEVTAEFDALDLDILPGDLPLRDLSGALSYSSSRGFSAERLKGALWGRPLLASVAQRSLPAAATVIDIDASVAMADLRRWLDQDWLDFARGSAALQARLLLQPEEPLLLSIDSDLKGIGLDLPAPWDKLPEDRRDLHLELSLAGEGNELALDMEGGLAARLALGGTPARSGGSGASGLRAATLNFGERETALEPGQFRIGGRLPRADMDQWLHFYESYLRDTVQQPGGAGLPLQLLIPGLRVDELAMRGNELGEARLQLTDEEGRWRIAGELDWLEGEWLAAGSAAAASTLTIKRLDLAELASLELTAADGPDVFEVPDMLVTVDGLQYAQQQLGGLSFRLSSEAGTILAEDVTGELAGMRLLVGQPGRFSWRQGEDSSSRVEANLHFQNLGDSLEQFGYQHIIETERGVFEVALDWPGTPGDFALASARGAVRVDIGSGHFPQVSGGASGTLRVVSILNLAEIVQQLSLSHMFESGIPFNTIEGEVFLHGGAIEVVNMDVEGGASSFQFSGVSEVVSRSLDGELIVTLPVANNLPWVAALTAGLPVAAGVFVLSKLFESQVNRLTSLVYSTSGSWDKPVVTFDRVFDDSASEKGAATPPQSTAP